MVWKQDLAKLKQALKESGVPEAKASPKPAPKATHVPARSLEEEDSMFLQAMGLRRSASSIVGGSGAAVVVKESDPLPSPPRPAAEDFLAAMGELKGVKGFSASLAAQPEKPTHENRIPESSLPKPDPVVETPEETLVLPEEEAVSVSVMPERIQLAAGMAIEVDGVLDLRGHTQADALERLRERLQDGVFLGWRTLHVHLDAGAELQEAFFALLRLPEARIVTRYAQAPIPMGGEQAWILYYALVGA
ncbi:MAG: Smr/MutS family protein [Firmicutes bacterium]|nr:Smr/MutS family protein [Bacillota bacterium]